MPIEWLGIERVTHEEDRLREARYWASKTIQERLSAGWALADHILFPEKSGGSEKRTGITLRRVPHSWR
jgi:hypothetical protein